MKNEILCKYLKSIFPAYKVKAEYSTNKNDIKVITVQEQSGTKVVFFDNNTDPLFNYYEIVIYGESIKEQKDTSYAIGDLIGKNITFVSGGETWQLMFMQMSNPQSIEYLDIRRVGYQIVLKTIIGKII